MGICPFGICGKGVISMKAVITVKSIAIHTGPGFGYATTGFTAEVGEHSISEVKKGAVNKSGTTGSWGKLRSGAGWICLSTLGVKVM